MELLHQIVNNLLHLQDTLNGVINTYHNWTYALLFLVIFLETGLVVTPFLPGDSLLFTAGAFAASGQLNLAALLGLLSVAAILGDAANYSIGFFFGERLIGKGDGRLIKKKHIDRTHAFYEKYGKKTIILARFVPIVRTFAPFLAGIGKMRYPTFAAYNVIGGVLWVVSLTMCGVCFGKLPFVKKHFELIVLGIVVVSILPMVYEVIRAKMEAKGEAV